MRFIVMIVNSPLPPLMDIGSDTVRELLRDRGVASADAKEFVRRLVRYPQEVHERRDLQVMVYDIRTWFRLTEREVKESSRLDGRQKKQAMAELKAMGKMIGIEVDKQEKKEEQPAAEAAERIA